ncbi:MAG: FAD-dependent oxidoreductase [Rhodothermales bacterium]|nr:FAD-dependent oxidoreductase [Rhodothermales bacterium]
MDKPSVTVIGAGVIGLSTAVHLLEDGFPVTVVARELHPDTTSSVAAAIWFPYEAAPADKVESWSIQTFRRYEKMTTDAATGVSMVICRWVSDHEYVRPDWSHSVGSFMEMDVNELPSGYTHGYQVTVPLIETPTYMPYLLKRFESGGGNLRINPRGIDSLDDPLLGKYIVNCSGLGASKLASDDRMFPIRGQVVSVENPGIPFATCDDESSSAVCYVLPRKNDCILGGVAIRDDWSTKPDLEIAKGIVERCEVLDPRLKGAKVLGHAAGLRPGRDSVRLELEWRQEGRAVIHNYGHGGAGFTLAWGCARDVLRSIKSL